MSMIEHDGWNYRVAPEGGDCRKLVTLEDDGMTWVGIRAYSPATARWLNNGEPEKARIVAWRDLEQPARGHWDRGALVVPRGDTGMAPMEAPTLGDHWTT